MKTQRIAKGKSSCCETREDRPGELTMQEWTRLMVKQGAILPYSGNDPYWVAYAAQAFPTTPDAQGEEKS